MSVVSSLRSPSPVNPHFGDSQANSTNSQVEIARESADDVAARLAANFFDDSGTRGLSPQSAGSSSTSFESIKSSDDSSERGGVGAERSAATSDSLQLGGRTFEELLTTVGDRTTQKPTHRRRPSELTRSTVDSTVQSGQATAELISLLTLAQNNFLDQEDLVRATLAESTFNFEFGTDAQGTCIVLTSQADPKGERFIMHSNPTDPGLSWTPAQFTAMQTAVESYNSSHREAAPAEAAHAEEVAVELE